MLENKDISQTPFAEVSTGRLSFPAPHFIEIDGQSVLLITGRSEVPLLVGDQFITVFSGEIEYYPLVEGEYVEAELEESPLQDIENGRRIVDFTVADFNNDDIDDIINSINLTESDRDPLGSGTIEYYQLNSNGLYQPLAPSPFTNLNQEDAGQLQTALDVNGDGLLDLVFATVEGDSSTIYLNNGDTFELSTAEVNLPEGIDLSNPRVIYSVDGDNDGDPDLVVKQEDNSLAFFRYQDGQYTAVAESENPFAGVNVVETNQLAFSDTDGDTDIDLLAIEDNGNISYYENSLEENDNPPTEDDDPNTDSLLDTSINRFQNMDIPGTYLYAGESESEAIREDFPDFTEEGLAFKVAVESGEDLIPLYRFQSNTTPGTYLYAGESERININDNFTEEFTEEGLAFYVYGAGTGQGNTFYRFQNENKPGTYLFAGEAERESILADFPNFIEEGAAFEVGV
ncbi:hypothetical protein H1P_270017 [Hyella patelloides LEGE 07179]|uniref:DUF5648 domain-containing protein n=1 Tax=Hyella patelloides LEGE 07179 TaxID=945734 RepID=A0A563VT14_9CYAN|nr:VCBS repeat-containing protein [Hyella patelloides]VEP14524.1 hypothetical protein H1P_270017 [Hyella patelloides LEGE 07179]